MKTSMTTLVINDDPYGEGWMVKIGAGVQIAFRDS